MPWSVPTGQYSMLVTECNVARRIFTGRAKIRSIADTTVGSNRQHLFDRKLGRIPKLDAVWQILAFVRQRVEWEKFRWIIPIAGWRRQFKGSPSPAWPSKREILYGTQVIARRY